jgi:hypothetical protein
MFGRPRKLSDTSTIQLAHGVVAHVGTHLLGANKRPANCWTYITQGLRQFGQKEIFFAINMPAPEAPQGPALLLDAIARLAAQGKLVDVGGFTEFGPKVSAALARRSKLQIRGMGYAQAHGIDTIVSRFGAVSKDFLAPLLLDHTELETARKSGLPRVLAQLSKHFRFYPYTIWNDPKRPSLISPEFLHATQLGHFGGTMSLQGIMPFREEGKIKLRIHPMVMPRMGGMLAACGDTNVGLLLPTTDGWTDTAACLAWHPGQHGPEALSSSVAKDTLSHFDGPGQKLLGCFIGFLIAARDEGAIMIEDGFIVFLNEDHAKQLSSALASQSSFLLESSGKMMDFELIPQLRTEISRPANLRPR